MKSIIKRILDKMWANAMELNKRNILSFVPQNSDALILDLGCDDGVWTHHLGKMSSSTSLFGVEVVEEAAKKAELAGVTVQVANLLDRFPFESSSMDIIHANQVIEHVSDLDHFMSEIYRVLKPGGLAIISTENASSWCNIFASIMGWQIFSLTNFSSLQAGIGNPLAIHRGDVGRIQSWTHKTIFNYRGLIDYFRVFGFTSVKVAGSGYFPLPAVFGRFDPRHSHFITVCAQKSS